MKKIKKDASPKIPKHGDTFNPNKTAATHLNLEVLSHELKRIIEGDDQ